MLWNKVLCSTVFNEKQLKIVHFYFNCKGQLYYLQD